MKLKERECLYQPINGLQFSTFLINVGNFLYSIVLFSETLLISSVSTSHSSIPINLASFFVSRLQLLTFHEYSILHFLIFNHSHLHLVLLHFCRLLQTFSSNKQSRLQLL